MEDQIAVKFKLAAAEKDLVDVYKLRYEVFSLEKNDYRYADSVSKTYKDINDNSSSKIVVAKNADDCIVGTLRITFRRENSFIADEIYQFGTLASILKINPQLLLSQLALLDRGVVKRDYRSKGVFKEMLDFAENICLNSNMTVLIATVNHENSKVRQLLSFLGWKIHFLDAQSNGWTGDHLYKQLTLSS